MLLAETNAKLLVDGTPLSDSWMAAHVLPPCAVVSGLCHDRRSHASDVDGRGLVGRGCASAGRATRTQPGGQCFLLSALARLEAARDLAISNPNLFWLLAVAVNACRITPDEVDALCRRKQAEIVRALTGNGTKAQVRFLRKVRVGEGTMTAGRILLDAAGDAAIVHALRHRSEIPFDLVQALATYPDLTREEVGADSYRVFVNKSMQ